MTATLAFSTLGCGDLDICEQLALAAYRRMDAVELRTMGGTTDILKYFETSSEHLRSSGPP
jgi:hypothetical protein